MMIFRKANGTICFAFLASDRKLALLLDSVVVFAAAAVCMRLCMCHQQQFFTVHKRLTNIEVEPRNTNNKQTNDGWGRALRHEGELSKAGLAVRTLPVTQHKYSSPQQQRIQATNSVTYKVTSCLLGIYWWLIKRKLLVVTLTTLTTLIQNIKAINNSTTAIIRIIIAIK